MRKLLLATTALLALSMPASADRLLGGLDWDTSGATLLTLGSSPGGGQTTNVPCIICGANQPNQTNTALGFGYTDYGIPATRPTSLFSSGILRDTVLGGDTISAPTTAVSSWSTS